MSSAVWRLSCGRESQSETDLPSPSPRTASALIVTTSGQICWVFTRALKKGYGNVSSVPLFFPGLQKTIPTEHPIAACNPLKPRTPASFSAEMARPSTASTSCASFARPPNRRGCHRRAPQAQSFAFPPPLLRRNLRRKLEQVVGHADRGIVP
jgi:hypothetical protein